MSHIELTIKIPAPPEGWGEVEFRQAMPGDYLLHAGTWFLSELGTDGKYPVARKLPPLWTPPPQWQAMFGDCWLSRDKNGSVLVHKAKPEPFHEHGIWECNDDEFYLLPFRPEMMPPDSIPWEECCFKIGDPKE